MRRRHDAHARAGPAARAGRALAAALAGRAHLRGGRRPGWTFGWIGIYHPYLIRRIARQVAATGAVLQLPPEGELAALATRLVRGAFRKDFRDRFEVELALFELALAYERTAQRLGDPDG